MKRSLTLKNIKKIDSSGMLAVLLDFPLQCNQALCIAKGIRLAAEKKDIKRVVFAGVGGSAIGAELVKSYLYLESRIPIAVVREYELPEYIDHETLVFISSYSGNTEETLSAYNQAKDKGAFLIAISSGGKLKDFTENDKVHFVRIPEGLPPRYALGHLSIIPLYILYKLGLISDVEPAINQAIKVLQDLKSNSLNPYIGQKDNISKYIAAKLYNKFPVVYSSSMHFDVVATRFRNQINENAKALASSYVFPEMNHNEVMGWQNPKRIFKDFVVLMFRDKLGAHKHVNKGMDIVRDLLKKEGVDILEAWSRGESLLSRIFSLIYIGDFASFYLAILYGVDPAPVDRIAYVKNKLREL